MAEKKRDVGNIQVKKSTSRDFIKARQAYAEREGLGDLKNDQFVQKLLHIWSDHRTIGPFTPFEEFMKASATASEPDKFMMDMETFRKIKELMTGREWYDRFRNELPFGADWKQAVEAAKRASGVEESA
jgi:hypothetical protein